ncbi:MAG: glycine betaine ABC transporter substrate-binding protein [Solirubrobacteraceae bacterium]
MHRSRLPSPIARPLAAVIVALGCAACGNAAAQQPASGTRTHRTTSAAAFTTRTTSSPTTSEPSATTATTPALPGTGKPTIVVGDKNYTEQEVLGQLYAQALQAQGYAVSVNPNIGPPAVSVQALRTGAVSMYPEYLNVFDTTVAAYRRGFRTQSGAYQAAERWALAHGLDLLAPTPFADTQALAVTDAYAAANHLRSISDLARISTGLTVGGPSQFQQGTPGLPAIAGAYGVTPAGFKALALGDQYGALNAATIQAADVYTTDGQLASGDYVVLHDPRHVFGWGNVVPVVSARAVVAEGPAFVNVIQNVDCKLTTRVMRGLNQLVDIAAQSPAAVAKQFLQTHGLLALSTASSACAASTSPVSGAG